MILAFTGQKGGVGKSTTSICVASEFRRRGRNVLLVDADPQGTTSTWHDVAVEQKLPTPTVVAMKATMHKPDQLPKLRNLYDVIVIDCPPRHGDIQKSALMAADVAIIPSGGTGPEAWAVGATADLITEAKIFKPALDAFILINRTKQQTVIGRETRDALSGAELPILKAELCDRVAFQEAITAGKGVTDYAPTDPASDEVRSLVDEIVSRFAPHLATVNAEEPLQPAVTRRTKKPSAKKGRSKTTRKGGRRG